MLDKIITLVKNERSKRKAGNKSLRNWYADKYQTILIQRNMMALLTVIALLCVGVGISAIYSISTSKAIQPFVIEVEDKTGLVHVVTPRSLEKWTANEALIKSFLVQYIRARESYYPHRYKEDYYQTVRIMSSERVYSSFRKDIDYLNPNSPIVRYGSSITRIVEFKSINIRDEKQSSIYSAQVRFVVQGDGVTGKLSPEHKIAIVDFEFLPTKEYNFTERTANPLGFTVTSYRVDQDVIQ